MESGNSSVREDVSPTRKREYLQAALRVLASHQDALTPRAVFEEMHRTLRPSGIELEPYPTARGIPRFETITRFMTIRAVKAGWMLKRDNAWQITPGGVDALDQFPTSDQLGSAAAAAYKSWRKDRVIDDAAADDAVEESVSAPETLVSFSLEDARERNKEALEAKIRHPNPYEVQDMIAALLRAMAYHVPYVAKPGRDRGLDIIAYRDPLGTASPRIKVQVKHSDQIGRGEIDKFVGAISSGDVGIFVSTGGFSPEARMEARTHRTHSLTLIDMQELIALWSRHYESIEQKGQALSTP